MKDTLIIRGVCATLLLMSRLALAGAPDGRPIVAFAGVSDPDVSNSAVASEDESAILTALHADENLQIWDPSYLDAQALPGRTGRLRLLDADAPQLQITAYPHSLGDEVLIVSVIHGEAGTRMRASLYGTARGNVLMSWDGTDAELLVRRIDEALGLHAKPAASGAVVITHVAPVVASSDVSLTLNATVKPFDGVQLVAYVRTGAASVFSPLTFPAGQDGRFTLELKPVHDGSIEYFLIARDAQGAVLAANGSETQPHFVQVIVVDNPFGQEEEPAPPPSHGVAYSSFAIAGAALVVAIVFSARTPNAANERRSCYTVATCQAKSSYLLTNETVAGAAWGATAVETGIGGLAIHFGW